MTAEKNCKMAIGNQEIKGMENGWSFSSGLPKIEFTGSFEKRRFMSTELKKDDLIKVYYDGGEREAIVTDILNFKDGTQKIYFKNK